MGTPKFIATDTETGGLDPRLNPLLSVSVLVCTDDYKEFDEGWEQKVLPPPKTLIEIPIEEHQFAGVEHWKKNWRDRKLYGYMDVHTKQIYTQEQFQTLENTEIKLNKERHEAGVKETFTERLAGVLSGKRMPLVINALAAEINRYIGHLPGKKLWDIETINNWHTKALPLDVVDNMYVKYIAQAFTSKPVAVAHYAIFDKTFIEHYLPTAFAQIHSFRCTCEMLRSHYKLTGQKGRSANLDTLIKLSGYKDKDPKADHSCLDDSRACMVGLQWLVNEKRAMEAERAE